MRKTLAVATVFGLGLGLLAGCSQQPTSTSDARTAATGTAGNAQAQRIGVPRPALGYVAHFASMPDRGELLAYDRVLSVKRAGAYTAYPVSISEEHALNAISRGDLVLNAPDGQPIRLKYESRVEHPDGNWTWIGRNAEGASAVLTFGENAVYGTIPQGATDVLRVTMSGGHSYVVSTDRSKLAGLGGMPHVKGSDFLSPPKRSGAGSLPGHGMFAAGATPVAAATATAGTAVVDVLVGYTDGYASANGGSGGVQTRLLNLIDYTNLAYKNSGVTMRVRLVGVKQVSYPDNTDNGDALEKLTGYSASSDSDIDPDPRFADLRAMRETVGADLVVLLRKFQTPENNGCGIAWLIGGNQQGITAADSRFGYSVVSDGQDRDTDQNNYYCIDATLAHELGHNMGQAHNKEDSKDGDGNQSYGLHAYSFGYREASSTGFHTVMAYPSSGDQVSVPYFANPEVKYIGRVTGVANQSDNTRSMNQSMPIVASFRATVIPNPAGEAANNDLDKDGKTDLLFRHPSNGKYTVWFMKNYSEHASKAGTMAAAYTPVAIADFNKDGRSEVLWTSSARDLLFTIRSGSTFVTKTSTTKYASGYKVVGAADMDGDGQAEIILHNASTGDFSIWFLKDYARKSSATGTLSGSAVHRLAATGDFDKDGREDLLWTSSARNMRFVSWKGSIKYYYGSPYTAAYTLAGAADVDGNGQSEVVLHDASTGNFSVWFLDAFARKSSRSDHVPTGYRFATKGDFIGSGSGAEDIVWTDAARHLLYTRWGLPQLVSTEQYAAGYALTDGP